jgi:anti-sigma regulatory factor (Ser/Thr protein kinase)
MAVHATSALRRDHDPEMVTMMSSPITQTTPTGSSALADIRGGGCAAWHLPPDASCAGLARSYVTAVATALALPDNLISDGAIAVSELATNAHQHAGDDGTHAPATPPELWIYPRTHTQQLIVTIFDARRDRHPELRHTDLLDEHGNGLRIVAALSADCGSRPTRSRLNPWPTPGKAVWYALALPQPWPMAQPPTPPGQAARDLHALLNARGIDGITRADRPGLSLLTLRHGPNIWAEPHGFWLRDIDGTPIRRPLADLQDITELVIHHHDQHSRQ